MTSSGAGADLNKDGFIADEQEANQMPCKILKELEDLWRDTTKRQCGWYNSKGPYTDDSDCKQLNKDRSTLYVSIFYRDAGYAMDRIKACQIKPE